MAHPPELFCKKDVLEILQNSQEDMSVEVFFLIKKKFLSSSRNDHFNKALTFLKNMYPKKRKIKNL